MPILAVQFGFGSPAWAIKLGDYVEPEAVSLQVRQADQTYNAIQETVGPDSITAMMNEDNQVFAIQIRSTAQAAPDPLDYLGEYADFTEEVISVIPLRGRVVRYSKGDQVAEWSTYGMSGSFSAQAISYDLAPDQVQQTYQEPE